MSDFSCSKLSVLIQRDIEKNIKEPTTANPKMKKFIGKLKIEIHHRIPQMYIGTGRLFPEAMRTSLSNLQGLPRKIHREVVSPAWTAFRKANPTPTRAEVIQQAMRIDKQVAEHIGRIN